MAALNRALAPPKEDRCGHFLFNKQALAHRNRGIVIRSMTQNIFSVGSEQKILSL
jgi:hypothetical protein